MGLKGLILSLVFIGAFFVAFFAFTQNFSNENNLNQSPATDPEFLAAQQAIFGNLSLYGGQVGEASNAFSNTTPIVNAGGINILPITEAWKKFTQYPKNVYDASIGFVFTKLFGDEVSSVLFYALGAVVVILIILAAWATIRTGVSD